MASLLYLVVEKRPKSSCIISWVSEPKIPFSKRIILSFPRRFLVLFLERPFSTRLSQTLSVLQVLGCASSIVIELSLSCLELIVMVVKDRTP